MNLQDSAAALLAGALVLAASNSLFAADWPQWRGPNRDGKVTGFNAPQSWPQQLSARWKVSVGKGDASPALVGDNLYTFGRLGAEEVLMCLDATTGTTNWEKRYPANHVVTGPPASHGGPRSSPAVAEGKVCTLGVGGILSCFDARTGDLVWRKQSMEDYLGIHGDFETAMSPLIADGGCVVGVGVATNGGAICFNLTDGKVKWKWDGAGLSFGSPVTMTVNQTRMIVVVTAKFLAGLRLSDGKLLWQAPFQADNNATPIVDGQVVFYGSTGGSGNGMVALKIEGQGDNFTATKLWSNKDAGSRFSTAVLKDGLLYGYNNMFFCVNAQTGATCWSTPARIGDNVAMLDAGSAIVGSGVKSQLVVFKPGDKEYTELARIKLSTTDSWAHPVLSGNRIYIRDLDSVSLWTLD